MKTKTITMFACVWLIFMSGCRLFAQYCPPRNDNPSNFDWMEDEWQFYITPPNLGTSLQTVPSPYHPVNFTLQPNTSGIHEDPDMGDYRTEDGWVLVAAKLSTQPSQPAVRFPQFVLYNRFESKLRYFAFVADKTDVDQIVVRIQFNNEGSLQHFTHVSAALEHVNVPMDVVEGYTDKRIIINVPNQYREQSGIWVMADIPIAYDPCTCQYGSFLKISTYSVNIQQIDFTLEGGGDIKQVIDGGKVVNQGSRFANVAGNIVNGISKGVSAYKTAGELATVAGNLVVSSANKKLTLDLVDQLNSIPGMAPPVSLVNGMTSAQANFLSQATNLLPGQAGAINTLFSKKLPGSLVPDWLKTTVPFANTALALLDFIIGGGKSTTPKPMHFQADFEFVGTGTMRDSTELDGLGFRVPGSKEATNLYAPFYDQVMGILNLVEPPVMYQAFDGEPTITTPDGTTFYGHVKLSLLLSESLKYALNPASGMMIDDIRAALYFYIPNQLATLDGTMVTPVSAGLVEDEQGIWRTPYVPLSCLTSYSIKFPIMQPFPRPIYSDIQLHLVAKLTSPAGKETAWAARYGVHTAPAPYTYENTPPNPFLNVREYVEVDNLEDVINSGIQAWNPIVVTNDIVVTPGAVEDFLNNGQPSEIITVTDPVTGISYQELVRKEVIPGNIIRAPYTIYNMPNCGDNPPMSAADLADICQNAMRYDPILALSRPPEEEIADWEDGPALPLQAPCAVLSPNPVSDQAWLDYHVTQEGPVSIFVSDHAGRRVLSLQAQVQHAEGAYRLAILVGELPSGVYFVSIVRRQEVETLKMVKR